MIKVFMIIVLSFSLFGCNQPEAETGTNAVDLKFGSVKLSIPQKYILSSLPSSIVPKEGLDVDSGISLKIPLRDFGLPEEGDVIILLSAPSKYLSEFGVSIDAFNAWNGLELYADRIIEEDDGTGLFRVGSEAAYPMFWHYFNAIPSKSGEPDKAWVASCYEAAKGKPTCSRQFVFNNTESKLTLSGLHIKSLYGLEEVYRELLSSWEI
jgi:hypothetical protein